MTTSPQAAEVVKRAATNAITNNNQVNGSLFTAIQYTLRSAPMDVAVVVGPMVVGTALVYRGFEQYRAMKANATRRM